MQLGTVYRADDLARPGAEPVPGFRLRHRLGRGTLGEVWQAEAAGGFRVALKFIRLSSDRADAAAQRILRIARSLRHPNLLVTFGAWTVEGNLILAMELADRTLWDRYREARAAGLPGIPPEELLGYLGEAARGLDHLNKGNHPLGGRAIAGMQHRHVKPQNILLFGDAVKVADFGMSRLRSQSIACQTGPRSFAYAAPEFFRKQATRQSDQYCLAITYCHMRGGRLPFEGSAGEVLAGHLLSPPDLSMLPESERPAVARALAKDPGDRWPSCGAFLAALRASVQTAERLALPQPAGPPGRVPPVAAPLRDACREPEHAAAIAAAFEAPAPVLLEALAPRQRGVCPPSRPARAVSTLLLFLAAIGLALWAANFALPGQNEPEPAPRSALVAPLRAFSGPYQSGSRVLAEGATPGAGASDSTQGFRQQSLPTSEADRGIAVPSSKVATFVRPARELPLLPEDVFAPLAEPPPPDGPLRTRDDPPGSANPPNGFSAGESQHLKGPSGRGNPGLELSLPEHVAVEAGKSVTLEVAVRRSGFEGPVSIRFEEAPEGVALERFTVSPKLNSARVTLAAAASTEPCVQEIRAVGVARGCKSVTTILVEVQLDPAVVHVRRGRDFLEGGDYHRAIGEFSQAIQLRPGTAGFYAARGMAFHKLGQLELAIDDYSRGLELEPSDAISCNNRGLAHRELGQYDKAIDDYTEAIRLEPDNPVVHFNRGMALAYVGDHLRAIADFTEAIRLRPQFADAYQRRGDCHALRGAATAAWADRVTASQLAGLRPALERRRPAAVGGD